MAKFFLGTILGAAVAFGYVRWDVALPEFLQLPDMLRGNLISTAVETDLYDLGLPWKTRKRALEIFFANRARFAAAVDGEFGYPFLKALYRRRVIREARQLRGQATAFARALEKPALREALGRTHGSKDPDVIRKRFLMARFKETAFLAQWAAENIGPVTGDTLLPTLERLGRMP